MVTGQKGAGASYARRVAYCAVMCALLIAVQFALSFISGVELVTLLLAAFSYVFGVWCGVLTAAAFSLLRCIVFGFTPQVVALYLIYYPLFALIFALLGKCTFYMRGGVVVAVAVNVALAALTAAPVALAAMKVIKISPAADIALNILFYVLAALFLCMLALYDASLFLKDERLRKKTGGIVVIATVAAALTICFTLLDDALAPLFLGLDGAGALGYFYASFAAMLPQTVCAVVSVFFLFTPLTAILKKLNR